ncbi:MAG: 4-hydroxy-3-methylbut-2-enyl diphosphate reductase [Firmicutes bacterium]|nr:4-hydroxy-3-methylbut-2-enyl diphosphate reductase [Bacillota bacterium]
MKVVRISPRGYCYGVVDAMTLATQVAGRDDLPRPIWVLGMIVHNRFVVEAFERLGIRTLDGDDRLALLDQVDSGTVIFTAHGVSPAVRAKAAAKGLTAIDATCPDVNRTHVLIANKVAQGFEIVYIGKHGHPEPEGAQGVAPEHVHVVQTEADVAGLADDLGRGQDGVRRIVVANQTTMSQWDTADLRELVLTRFPDAQVHNEICDATQVRQDAVARQVRGADLCIVVGDPKSNNTARLAQVAQDVAGVPALRVSSAQELDPARLRPCTVVAVTSGASTPTPVTRQVIEYLEQFDANDASTWPLPAEIDLERLLPMVRP